MLVTPARVARTTRARKHLAILAAQENAVPVPPKAAAPAPQESTVPTANSNSGANNGVAGRRSSRGRKGQPPERWEEMWDGIAAMRSGIVAPVDTMGCESLADGSASDNSNAPLFRYQCLVGLMLSAQTRDEVTSAAVKRLQQRGLTPENVLKLSAAELAAIIRPVGFFNVKAKHLLATTAVLVKEYGGDVPGDLGSLVRLPGVGPKMAHLFLQVGYGRTEGIGVDVHVHRLCNRMGWVGGTRQPEDTRRELEDWLPQDRWRPVNKLLVGFGQMICKPVRPLCDQCTINHLCPSAFKEAKPGASRPGKKQRRPSSSHQGSTTNEE